MVNPPSYEDNRVAGQRRRRMRERQARCVRLPSGGLLDLRNPDSSVITLQDVASRLAACPRFAGEGISVAAHSVLVAQRLREQGYGDDVVLAGLLHDCAESVTGDLITPVKKLVRGFTRIEHDLEAAILTALDLTRLDLHYPPVKLADEWSLLVETDRYDGPPIRLIRTRRAAEQAFLREYFRASQPGLAVAS